MWPKYYKNMLIVNQEAVLGIGIITGWTKKEEIYSLLPEELRKNVLVIGQLYSKEGINYIIRNIFLNPKIRYLFVTGRDLSGSQKIFKEFLEGNRKDFLHKEIPIEKIIEFTKHFKQNTFFVEQENLCAEIEKLLQTTEKNPWTEAHDFEDPQIIESTDFPSEEVGFRLEDEKIADLWVKVLDYILKFGRTKMSSYGDQQRELINLMTVIGTSDDPENPYLPEYMTFNKQDLENYFPQLMTANKLEGIEYTYGSRLRDHEGINQIQSIIEELRKENYSRRAIAFTWNVKLDNENPKCPCLNLIHFLVQNNTLYMTVYIRSNDMFGGWPRNAYSLLKIFEEVREPLGLKSGKLAIISASAHIYERDFVAAMDVVNNHNKLWCRPDPRGNFEIQVSGDEIHVTHYTPEGIPIQIFTGKTAVELRNQIYKYVSDTIHAIYLGTQLAKAENAIRSNTEFIQD